MRTQSLKLKQASAVLQMHPKELQNLVQFGIVKPRRAEGTYYFDTNALLAAKVASYLKESLGTRTSVLSKLMAAFRSSRYSCRCFSACFSARSWALPFSSKIGKRKFRF